MLYLVRHAQSKMNVALATQARLNPAEFSAHWDQSLIDADLTPEGEIQIKSNRPMAQELHVTKIYVSPLLRTLKTCKGLFSDHPNAPEVIVQPLMTEIITDCGDVSRGSFSGFPSYSDYDWSAVESLDSFYWMYDICESPYLAEVRKRADSVESIHGLICEIIKEIAPTHFETETWARNRMLAFKSLVMRDLDAGESIAVVGHSDFFRFFSRSFPGATEATLLNCQILHFPVSMEETMPRL
jgi:broad specificity phosphatase PhoE